VTIVRYIATQQYCCESITSFIATNFYTGKWWILCSIATKQYCCESITSFIAIRQPSSHDDVSLNTGRLWMTDCLLHRNIKYCCEGTTSFIATMADWFLRSLSHQISAPKFSRASLRTKCPAHLILNSIMLCLPPLLPSSVQIWYTTATLHGVTIRKTST